MKKIITLLLILLNFSLVYGQQTADNILKARALREQGKSDQAIALLNSALNSEKSEKLYLEMAEANIIKGDYSEAINDFNEANMVSPSSGEYGLARIYALKGDAATSIYHLELSMRSSYKKPEKEILLDPAFSTLENRQEWKQFWKTDWYTSMEKGMSEIEYYVAAGKTDEAKATLADLKKSHDEDAELQYAEALIFYSAGKYPEALKLANEVNNSDQNNEKYLRLLAKIEVAASDAAGASSTYSRMINSGVYDADLYLQRAECYNKTGETDKAVNDVNKYLEFYPNDSKALSLAGKVEAKSGDNLKALKYFSDNLKLHPNDPQCYVDRGNSYFIAKSWDMAINDYSMSLDLKPGNSDVWLNKGIALLNQGKVEDACHDFRKAFSLGNKRVSEYISKNCIR